jgi:hypothetical protein
MPDGMTTLTDVIRRKKPALGLRARRSPAPAIRLFCLTCMGGSQKLVAECGSRGCPLYPFRFGKRPKVTGDPWKTAPEATPPAPTVQPVAEDFSL